MSLDIDTDITNVGDSDIGSGIASNIGDELGSIDMILAVVSAAICRVVSAAILDQHIPSAAVNGGLFRQRVPRPAGHY